MTGTSTDDAEDHTTVGPDAADYERYATVALEDGGILLYDREHEEAWIQADTPVDVTETA